MKRTIKLFDVTALFGVFSETNFKITRLRPAPHMPGVSWGEKRNYWTPNNFFNNSMFTRDLTLKLKERSVPNIIKYQPFSDLFRLKYQIHYELPKINTIIAKMHSKVSELNRLISNQLL